jgi:hypothetical protein
VAELRAAQGDGDGAAGELDAARAAFGQMRAPRLVQAADRLAERLGVRRA